MPDESLKILGPLSILIAVTAGVILVRRWPLGRGKSISAHGGAHRKAYWLYACTLTLSGLLFYAFARWWLAPTLGLPNLFNIILLAAVVLQIMSAWVPDRDDKSPTTVLHRRAAYGLALCMMALTACIMFTPAVALVVRAMAYITFGLMAISWYRFLFDKKAHEKFLIYQSMYIGSFFVLILLATYVR